MVVVTAKAVGELQFVFPTRVEAADDANFFEQGDRPVHTGAVYPLALFDQDVHAKRLATIKGSKHRLPRRGNTVAVLTEDCCKQRCFCNHIADYTIYCDNIAIIFRSRYHDCMIVFFVTVVAALAALAGGYVAIHNRDRLHIAIALTAGLVLGLVAFDLLPEIFSGVQSAHLNPVWPMVLFAGGFLFFHVVEKLILVHHEGDNDYKPHSHPKLGVARAIALAGHSFLDGLSIGVAFQVSSAVGTAVALAVIGHRFADGFDTASFMLLHRNKVSHIKKFLAVVVAMPVIGGLSSLFVPLSEAALTLYLGFFAGILMYIAASNILPQAHVKGTSYRSVGLTLLGAAFMFIITRFI